MGPTSSDQDMPSSLSGRMSTGRLSSASLATTETLMPSSGKTEFSVMRKYPSPICSAPMVNSKSPFLKPHCPLSYRQFGFSTRL
jgi:hypothetical protein